MRDDRAEGSVVGVILAIAIVIALAAAVWLFASIITQRFEGAKDKPDFAVTIDDTNARLTVVRASNDLDYVRDLKFGGTCQPTLNGGAFPTAEGTLVKAQDILGCGRGQSITISSSQAKGNSLLFQHTFP